MMKNAMVVGATSFVGFSLCKKLIHREVEVYGVELSTNKAAHDEDKLMEIGRNAYFRYQGLFNRESLEAAGKFDAAYFCLETEEMFKREYQEVIAFMSEQSGKVFLVTPRIFAETCTILQKLLKHPNSTLVVHPALFGPWQPQEEPIQRKIIEELTGEAGSEKLVMEDQDILYVEDFAEMLIKLSEQRFKKESRTVRLASKDNKALKILADEMDIVITDKKDATQTEWEKDAEVIYVESSLEVTEALSLQRQHTAKRLKIVDNP